MDESRWLPVPGYEGSYEVSDHGEVRSLDRPVVGSDKIGQERTRIVFGRGLAPQEGVGGYLRVELSRDGRRESFAVHRLVAAAFLPQPEPGQEVCHLNHDPADNHVSNLRWGTHSENVRATVRAGRHRSGNSGKTHCPAGHRYSGRNARGDRKCAPCRREQQRRYRARRAVA